MQKCILSYLLVFLVFGLSPLTASADPPPPWQNENLSENPWNQIHNDSWFTDSYRVPGPTQATGATIKLIQEYTFLNPQTDLPTTVKLGECAAHTYTSEGNLQTVCGGFPNPITNQFLRSIVQISPEGDLLAYQSFEDPFNNIFDAALNFGGAGYFYQDKDDRVVMGMPNGHIIAWERNFTIKPVDPFVDARDIAVIQPDGPIPQAIGSFYALLVDAEGYIWFTTSEGVVGTISPDTVPVLKWINVNVADPGLPQRISEAHSINENTMYQQTDRKMYRFDRADDGTPQITWSARYDRGSQIKPGQTSQGSGTSPSYFEIGDRQFVTIFDNAERPNIVVFRADELQDGESREVVKAAPFGNDTRVSNENSLVVYRVSDTVVRIYAENNWGNTSLLSTAGPFVTRPGYGGLEMDVNGLFRVLPPNRTIRIPSVVSKGNVEDELMYTYNKTREGWFLTAMDANDLANVVWTVQTGPGQTAFNSWYAQLSLAPGGESHYVGVTVGFLIVTPNNGPPTPANCFLYPGPKVFTDRMRFLGEWTEGPAPYANFTQSSLIGFSQTFFSLWRETRGPVRRQIQSLLFDLFRARLILGGANYNVSQLGFFGQRALLNISNRHNPLLQELKAKQEAICPTPE